MSPYLKRARAYLRGQQVDYKAHPGYLEATAFREEFTPADECDYKWLVEYAKDRYKGLDETFRSLDEKADSLIKYLGGGTAVVALGSLATSTYYNAWVPLLLLPSLCCALRAVYLAVSVRTPTGLPHPPPVTVVHKYPLAYKEKAEATTLGSWHECTEGLAIVNGQKAEKVTKASRWYFWSLTLLLVPVVVWPMIALFGVSPKQTIRIEIVNQTLPR